MLSLRSFTLSGMLHFALADASIRVNRAEKVLILAEI